MWGLEGREDFFPRNQPEKNMGNMDQKGKCLSITPEMDAKKQRQCHFPTRRNCIHVSDSFWGPKHLRNLAETKKSLSPKKTPEEQHQTAIISLGLLPIYMEKEQTSSGNWNRNTMEIHGEGIEA